MKKWSLGDVGWMVDMGCPEKNPKKRQIECFRPLTDQEERFYKDGIYSQDWDKY